MERTSGFVFTSVRRGRYFVRSYVECVGREEEKVVSYRFGAITIPHIDWIEPLRLECEDFAHAIRTGDQPRAHGHVGLEVVRVLADVQEVSEVQERQYARAVV